MQETTAISSKKADYKDMSVEERIDLVENIFITYPELTEIIDRIGECHRRSIRSAEPKCLFIIGNPGCGKTTIATFYENLYPRQTAEEGETIPILSSTVFCPATVKGIVTGLLDSLGDPRADRGTITNQTLRLYKLLKKCGVQLIILDEFQHLIDRDSDKVLGVASDWLKNVLNKTRIPMILIGLPYSVRILKANEQLRRRFSVQKELIPFAWETPNQQKGFKRFIKAVEDALPFNEKSYLYSTQMAFRLYCASGGVISNVMKVVRTAAIMALRQGRESLMLDLLAAAYDDEIASLYPTHPNPFLAEEDNLVPLPPDKNEPLKKSRSRKCTRTEAKESINTLLAA